MIGWDERLSVYLQGNPASGMSLACVGKHQRNARVWTTCEAKGDLERQEERLTGKVLEWMVVERRQKLRQELQQVRSRYDQQRGLLMIIRQMLYSKKRSESLALLKRLESYEGKVYPQVIAF